MLAILSWNVWVSQERAAALDPGKTSSELKVGMGVEHYQRWLKEMPIWTAQQHQKFLIPVGPWKPHSESRAFARASPITLTTILRLSSDRERQVSSRVVPSELLQDLPKLATCTSEFRLCGSCR